jgi:hypothetical protein
MRQLVILAAFVTAGVSLASDWAQVQNGPQHHGYTKDVAAPPYQRAWQKHFGYERIGRCVSAIIADGKVFVGTKQGAMRALKLENGDELWSYKAGGPILHSAAASDGKVIFASLDGKVYAVGAEDGKEKWVFDSGFGFSNAPLIIDGFVLIGNRAGNLFCIKASDGKEVWRKNLGAPIFQTAGANEGKVYVGSEDMYMHALNIADGSEFWKSDKLQGQTFKDYWPVVHKGYVIVRPMVVAIEWLRSRDVPPFGWNTDAGLLKEAMESYPAGKELPKPFMEAQDELVKYYTENPEYEDIYFLNESDGKAGFVSPLIHVPALGGAVPPPSVMENGLLAVAMMADQARWGAFDVEKQRIVDIWPYLQGNNDETHISASTGPVVLILHCREGWATGAFDTRTRKRFDIPMGGPRSVLYDNLVNGASAPAVSGAMVVHISCSTVKAWKGQGGEQ